MEQSDKKFNTSTLIEVVKAIVIVSFTIVVAYKLIVTPITLSMDFYALLSLLLALFSVGLSALFYFKATDTSNAFYDNTYKFTKDIAELLVRIESGFGERLRHLDEGYTRIQDRFYPQLSKEEIAETQKQVKEEEENLNSKLKERDKLIEELVQKSQLEGKEKQKFLDQLKKREAELQQLQFELTLSKAQATELEEINHDEIRPRVIPRSLRGYTMRHVIERMPKQIWKKGSASNIHMAWREIVPSLPRGFISDLRSYGLVDSGRELTSMGVSFMKALASEGTFQKDESLET